MNQPQHGFDEALISGYLDGELTQGDRQRVEVHLDECEQCRRTYDDMARLRTTIADLSFGERGHAAT